MLDDRKKRKNLGSDNPGRSSKASFPFSVVAIGASAGGIEALRNLLQHLPADTGAAFLVILHLDPDHESHLAEVLGRETKMPVVQITDRMPIEPDRVHVIAPDLTLTIEKQQLRLKPPLQERAQRRPVDELFRSLAASAGDRAVAVVMSGTGSNGSAGLVEVKANDGVIFAQKPETAKFDGMPRNAIQTGLVDQVLAPQDLATAIAGYVERAGLAAADDGGIDYSQFQKILLVLREHSQLELQGYRRPTIARRIRRRMSLRGLPQADDYLALLRNEDEERDALINDLMINVTSFFRDAESWAALEKQVIVPLVEQKERGGQIRCWVPACSTGEEAYTLAILLTEHAEQAAKNLDVKVFGTDLSREAISRARAGIFSGGVAIQIPPERLGRFFKKEDDHYCIKKKVREKITFAPHDLMADAPFSRLDIVTCRNVLIYLEPDVQRKVLNMLHFALRPNGVLMLGSSESTRRGSSDFQAVDQKHKIYRQVGGTRHEFSAFPVLKGRRQQPTPQRSGQRSAADDVSTTALQALANLIPAAALLDSRQRVLYFHGDTDRYLAHPHGKADLDVYAMVRPGLEAPVRSVIGRVRHERESRSVQTSILLASGRTPVRVTATPLERDGLVLLSFQQQSPADASGRGVTERAETSAPESETNDLLREELRHSHLELARTIEELEKTNEDLTASNEEVMSINEELQSTNEELETSKEELQSLNEELATVNTQLQNKVDELESASNNLSNLLKSSEIATLFLSRNLEVMWFTPAVGRLFSLIDSDVGRPITDLAQKFIGDDIREDCEQVLKSLVPSKKEIRDKEGRWYLRRTNPYRTSEDKIDGIVMTFLDISENKQTERKARHAAARARKAAKAKDDFLARLSHELRTPLQPALLGLSGLAARDDLPDEVPDKIDSITRNIEIEIRLIDDLLDLTRVGHGKLRLRRERIDAVALIRDSIRLCREESAAKRQHMIVEGRAGESWIDVDKIRLQQVIWNLLRNAIHFTKEGGTVRVHCERRGEQVLIEVIDDGAGIPPNLLPRIFDSFERSDETFSGLGLGLSIAKSLVEAHDGTIEAESEGIGRGSTFRVTVPAAEAPEPKPELDSPSQNGAVGAGKSEIAGLRVLVLEDHPDSAQILASLLQAAGCHTETAASKKDALIAVGNDNFDVILSDLALADGSAYDLIDRLPRDVPVVAISGYGAPQDIERSIASGFVEHLVKPVTFAELSEAIKRALPRRSG